MIRLIRFVLKRFFVMIGPARKGEAVLPLVQRRVLFLSTGNAARSLMAEALLNAKGSDRYTAKSAGFAPVPAVPAATLHWLAAAGLSTQGLRSKSWDEYVACAAFMPMDVVVTLSEEARLYAPVFPNDPVRVHWALDDPLGAPRAEMQEWKFRKCLSVLDTRLSALVRGRVPASSAELYLQLKDLSMVI